MLGTAENAVEPHGERGSWTAIAYLSPVHRHGSVIGFVADIGRGLDGRRRRRFFREQADAERFLTEHVRTSSDPLHGRRHEVLFCLERLDQIGISLHEVVEFYLKHGAKQTNPPLADAVRGFLDQKRQVGRGGHYLSWMQSVLDHFQRFVGTDAKVGHVTVDDVRKFAYVEHGHTNAVTKANVLRHLNVFFNYCRRHDLIGFNPVEKVERPTIKFRPPNVLTPDDFHRLLTHCLDHGFHDRLTLFVLVGFCGVRIEEASKLKWSDLDFDRGTVLVPAEVAKKHGFRKNKVPSNAMQWLHLVRDRRRSGLIIGKTWKTLVRSAIISSRIEYNQNAIRHSFCSYALAAGWPLSEVVSSMGHAGNSTVIFSHYRNVVSEEDGKRWFAIVPQTDVARSA